ncbi:MAG TPA: alpha/beta fold hydrolase [Pyrinomonadaceae bacterium]
MLKTILLIAMLASVVSIQDDVVSAARSFTDLLAKKDFAAAEAQFDDTMKTAMPHGKLEETWTTLLSQAGEFKQQGKARTENRGAYTIVFITCDFEKAKLDVRVVLDQAKHVSGLFFGAATNVDYSPAPYVKPDAFKDSEVVIGSGEWTLPGTLSMPVGKGPFPAIVLVHGSGPNDRDETISVNKPFRDLAEGLASKGIAVLRYEKRSRVYPGKFGSSFTVKEEVVDDALAAVALLRKTEGINPKRIFVLGHSLGGMLVPRIGKQDPAIAGLISLAGATRHLEDVIPVQYEYLFSLDGSVSPEEQAQIDQQKLIAAEVKALKPSDVATVKFYFGAPPTYWLDLRDYDPPQLAKTLSQPLLILQGERDYQVTMLDFNNWKTALAAKKNVSFKTYPELNHLFMSGTGKGNPGEYDQVGHVDARVLDDIAAWITAQK